MKKSYYLFLVFLIIPVLLFGEEISPKSSNVDIGLKAVGIKVGMVVPNHDNYYTTLCYSAVAFLGSFGKYAQLEVGFRYWDADMDYSGYKDNPYDDGRYSDMMFFPTIKLVPSIKSIPVDLYVGAGLGINMYKTKPDKADNPIFSEESETRLEPHFDLGATYDVIPEIKAVLSAQINISDISSFYVELGALFNLE